MNYGIEDIKKLASNKQIKWSGHVTQRMIQRNINRKQVIDALLCGEIIEEYQDDYPYPSYLVFALISQDKPLHVVCSIGQNNIWIITVYKPNNIKWHSDFKTRKDVN